MQVIGLVAVDELWGIANSTGIPWRRAKSNTADIAEGCNNEFMHRTCNIAQKSFESIVTNDMIFFRTVTQGATVLMGAGTFADCGALLGRTNLVLTTRDKQDITTGSTKTIFGNLQKLLAYLDMVKPNKLFIIGGEVVYNLFAELYDIIYVSTIPFDWNCTKHMHILGADQRYKQEEYLQLCPGDPKYCNKFTVVKYSRNCNQLNVIADLISKIDKAPWSENRTIERTKSIYNYSFDIDLSGGILPLCPYREQNWKMIFEELMWFLRGETDIRILQKKGIKIWDANCADSAHRGKKTCDLPDCSGGCEECANNIGRTYGAQWRRFGAQKFDQLAYVVNELQTNPSSRRIFLSGWCPPEIFDNACLPPCHISYAFNVDSNKNLYCQVLQRSSDVGCGLAWNIASAGLLTHLLAKTCGLNAHRLSFTLCNVHIYEPHLLALKVIYKPVTGFSGDYTTMLPYPKVIIHTLRAIDEYVEEDLCVIGYNPLNKTKLKMVV